jgi:tetratricopeptide (TPR) repeat protein/predicted Ser/Thr protein kinase
VECPGEDTLVAWVEHALHASARVELEDHVDGCTHCRTTIGHLAATGAYGPEGSSTIGRYTLVRRLGAGGMGVVWLAHDPELDRRVALKVLRGDVPTTDDQLRREARAMASLSHPNVVRVYDVASSDGHVFVTMEYIEGTTLRGWLAEQPRSWRDVLDACVKAGRGLAAAHAAGIVHRDFKPDNVLCGGDRVLVADFGLARIRNREQRLGNTEPGAEPKDGLVTRTGHRLGTLRYMAPEQLCDGVTDARSDQWSLGVTLYEALWGVGPFRAPSLDGLLAEIRTAQVHPAPASPHVPAKIRQAILRCLAADPTARYPSVETLLDELASELPVAVRRRRLRLAVAGIVAAALVVAGVAYRQLARAHDPELQCASGAEQISDAWDEARSTAVHRAWVGAHAPYAEDVWRSVDRAVHGRTAAWKATFHDACVAARVHGTHSEAMLDRQMACLDRRSRELRALVDSLADPGSLDRAVSAVAALPDPAGCSDLDALASIDAPPTDLGTRVTRETIELQLARAVAALALWKFRDARDTLARVEPQARKLGYRPLLADVLFTEAKARVDSGDEAQGIALMRDGLWLAEASRSDEAAAEILLTLGYAVGARQLHFDEAAELLHRAEAAVERAGRTPQLLGLLARRRGDVAIKQGRYEEAAARYGEAVAIVRSQVGPASPELAHLVSVEATAYEQLGRYDEARARYEAALQIEQALLGDSHPDVAITLQSLGIVDEAQGKFHDAVAREAKSLAIFQAALGPRHRLVAQAHDELASAYYQDGNTDRALAEYQSAIDIAAATRGARDPSTAHYLGNRAVVLSHLGKLDEAYATLQRELAIEIEAFGEDHPNVAETRINVGSLLHEQGKDRQALASYRAALVTLRRARDSGHPQIASAMLGTCVVENGLADYQSALGDAQAVLAIAKGPTMIAALVCETDALLGLGLAERARATLEHAAALAVDDAVANENDRAEIQFALARDLWALGDHQRARTIAAAARANLADEVRVRLDRWLAAH